MMCDILLQSDIFSISAQLCVDMCVLTILVGCQKIILRSLRHEPYADLFMCENEIVRDPQSRYWADMRAMVVVRVTATVDH